MIESAAIELRFFGATGFSSRAIEWISSGRFSHVACVWSDTELLDARSDVIAGVPPGVRVRKMSSETAALVVSMKLECAPAQMTSYRNFLAAQIGKPYDKMAIWGFAFNRNWREDDAWDCSELQSAALEAAGICPALYTPTCHITPSALATIVSALGATVI